ncbi:MAG: hypothetical protein V2A54_00110 [Bacteroidota bacterium]
MGAAALIRVRRLGRLLRRRKVREERKEKVWLREAELKSGVLFPAGELSRVFFPLDLTIEYTAVSGYNPVSFPLLKVPPHGCVLYWFDYSKYTEFL